MGNWTKAREWTGADGQKCGHCGGAVNQGEWYRVEVATGKVLHDDCSEDVGAYV